MGGSERSQPRWLDLVESEFRNDITHTHSGLAKDPHTQNPTRTLLHTHTHTHTHQTHKTRIHRTPHVHCVTQSYTHQTHSHICAPTLTEDPHTQNPTRTLRHTHTHTPNT